MKLNNRGIAPIVIVIIVAILAVAGTGGGVWYWQNQQVQKQKQDSDKKIQELEKQAEGLKKELTTVKSESETSDETANWKTYTNDKYGFSFKYPSSLFLTECAGKIGKEENTPLIVLLKEEKKSCESPDLFGYKSIDIEVSEGGGIPNPVDQYVQKREKGVIDGADYVKIFYNKDTSEGAVSQLYGVWHKNNAINFHLGNYKDGSYDKDLEGVFNKIINSIDLK